MITIRDILSNISSGQSSIRVKSILRDLEEFYKSIAGKIQITYATPETGGFTVYYRLPSETYEKLYYDVVIWYNTPKIIGLDTQIKVFSNSPGFAYNFAWVFHQDKSLLFTDKYPPEFLRTPPKMKNPLRTKAFDKHVYASLKSVTRYHLDQLTEQYKNTVEPKVKTLRDKVDETTKKQKKKD